MKYDNQQAREIFQKMVEQKREYTRKCSVVSVDLSTYTCVCSPIDNTTIQYTGVMLTANSNATMVYIPTQDSTVLVAWSNLNIPYVSMFSQIDNYYFGTANDSMYQMFNDLITYITSMTILTNQGATLENGIINTPDFINLQDRLKKFFLK